MIYSGSPLTEWTKINQAVKSEPEADEHSESEFGGLKIEKGKAYFRSTVSVDKKVEYFGFKAIKLFIWTA